MDPARTELLVRLLTANQERLYRYVLALVPHEPDARDIVQEACVSLCQKFENYDPAQPFLPWAYRFAYHHVLRHRQRQGQEARLLGADVIEMLAREQPAREEALDLRLQALDVCLEALSEEDKALVRQRYQADRTMEEVATQLGMSRRTLFRNLGRVRRLLHQCINRRLAGEGLA